MRRISSANWLLLSLAAICALWLFFASDDHLRRLLKTTTILAAWIILFTLPLGALLSLFLSRTDLPGGKTWPFLCAALLILPSYIQISGWHAIIGPVGWAQAWIPRDASLAAVNWWSAILLHSILALPGVVLLISFGLARSEAELEEVALLHWTWPIVLFRVSLRRAAPLLLAAALWIFVTVSGEIAVTDIYQIRTLAEEIYLSTGNSVTGTGEYPYAGILPFLLLTSLATFLALTLTDGALRVAPLAAHRRVRRFPLGPCKWPLAALFAALFLLLILVPLASLIYKAGLHIELDPAGKRFQAWSLHHTWGTLKTSPLEFSDVLYWTFLHCTLAGATTLLLALPLAWLERSPPFFSSPRPPAPSPHLLTSLLILLTIAIPGPLVGIGLQKLLSSSGDLGLFLRDRTLFSAAAASAIRALPWIVLLLRYSFQTIPQEQLELARLFGWGSLRSLFGIALPQRWPIIAAALIFSICLSLSDVATSLLVVPPGVALASVRMMGMLHSGVDNPLAGLALLLIACFLAAITPLAWLFSVAQSLRD